MDTITSLHNPLVKHFVKLRENSAYRKEQSSVLVMGEQLIEEVMQIAQPKAILTCTPSHFPHAYLVTEAILKKVSALVNPEGVVAEFPLPSSQVLVNCPSLIVLDQLADPGNVGTLLRTALALNWGGVFFLTHSVDPFNDKVMRASRAALFKLPWQMGSWEELQELARAGGFTPLIADLEGTSIVGLTRPQKPLLLLSCEARGVLKTRKTWAQRVTIPISSRMESLNVAIAGGILMYCLHG